MGNLKLITTERFGNLDCNFYRNMNDDILLTREQIGTALEYSRPDDALSKIHRRHKDRFEGISVLAKLAGTDGKEYETYLYTQRGVMEICRWSNKPKANLFMDWVWDIVEKYRNKELHQDMDMKPIVESMATMADAITSLSANMTALQKEVTELKYPQNSANPRAPRHPSAFFRRMWPKYKMLMEYFGCNLSRLYSSIYGELKNTYDVDIDQMYEDYCYENGLTEKECYRMDAVERNAEMRDAVILLINDALVKYGLQTEDQVKKSKITTLFDRIPA